MRIVNVASLCCILVSCSNFVFGQDVRRATLLQYRSYMIDVISATMQQIEDFQWCNLKIPEFSQKINYQFFGREVSGDVTYKNGFVVSIQHIDILESSVQQIWRWNRTDQYGTVELRAQLRLNDLLLGFDVIANLNNAQHRYTSTFKHTLVNFNFSILKNMQTNKITVTVTGVNPGSTGFMEYIPNDIYSELLGTTFLPALTVPGMQSWGPNIFQPRAYIAVTSKVAFPEACYNC